MTDNHVASEARGLAFTRGVKSSGWQCDPPGVSASVLTR
jgi:hypothetical protein